MPARFGTLNEWSPFSTTWSAAGASSFARIGRSATAVLDIGKIERDRIDAARRKPGREAHQERALLPRAGAVRQHERNARALPRVRRIGERAHIFAGRDVDAKRVRHNARQYPRHL